MSKQQQEAPEGASSSKVGKGLLILGLMIAMLFGALDQMMEREKGREMKSEPVMH